MTSSPNLHNQLSLQTKFFYGVGELAATIPSTLLVFFLLFFLTDVAGLNASLAGTILLIGKAWDAINDPLVGWLSDRTKSRFGKRYPWMIWGAIPFGVVFMCQWLIPPLREQKLLFVYYLLIIFFVYGGFTAVILPFTTLAAELTQKYQERISLISYKSFFSIGGSLGTLILAQLIFEYIPQANQRYLILGIVSGVFIIASIYLCIWGTFPQYKQRTLTRTSPISPSHLSFWQQLRLAVKNRPFLILMGVYLCSWLSVQVTAAILPYFVVNCMNLSDNHVTQMAISVQGTALVTMFLWNFVGRKWGKKAIYFGGVPIWILAQIGLFFLKQDQVQLMYIYAVMIGIGLATAYLVPQAMLPDVIDFHEWQTGQRTEGIFYGFLVQIQKFSIALSLFMIGKTLDWSGYISHQGTELNQVQPETALWAIRSIIAPLPSLALIVGLILLYFYPITRQFHQKILLQLMESSKNKDNREQAI